ncbi:hypothetical protein [Thermomonas sp.]|uniref:hypothetical protein n=1 Tax=Thermomonas sp. TaxID=1971895 RepID=UPI0035B3D068
MQLALLPREITPETVTEALEKRVGAVNGASVRELASEVLGRPATANDERRLRLVVVQLRRAGYPLCATPDEGYHKAANAADLQRTCVHLVHRLETTSECVAAMLRIAAPELYGQFGLPIPAAKPEDTTDEHGD